ncbi:pyruvate dehydrogenase phosphatase [Xylona heveae TC161]|uniref:Pyruvate dehydrogenase phosphatase n=1 Tax=Xylona heveae (strain CBS 132557 / TC161) TaxID=1328760 RepID=A0A165J6C0_XYLHT|nr:pyruvate dehydrogenase phosphatase [Xylona heveae TC161]KZF25793.1 pyruvate dehydrogenase phosphatase [Xylona heveae TC161]
MRRATVQAFRTARRASFHRKLGRGRYGPVSSSNLVQGLRSISSGREHGRLSPLASSSSMYFRNFSLALISTVVLSGAWYSYRDNPSILERGLHDRANASTSASSAQHSNSELTASNVFSTAPSSGPSKATADEAALATRRAVVVEPDQFYTGSIVGDEPLSKETDDAGRKLLEMLTPDQATQKLRRNEESYLVGRGRGVVRYDVVQIPSNDPIEDDHAEKIVEVPQTVAATEDGSASSDWMFWGVFDGHSGWTTSAKLRQVLISFVARELNATYKSALTNPASSVPSPESIDTAIKKGFLKLDHEIIHESVEKVMKANAKRVAAELLAPALSGSCALLSFYDSRSKLLRVACTGDSRAVLGRRGASGKWTATPLSVDQTGSNEEEAARLRREHPGEEYVVRNGRILGGLEPSRAFGDSFYKWTKETQERIKMSFFGRTPSQLLRTPPYVTAEPVITTTRIEPEKGDFVVMATDGLWEMLSNEEVVGLVGQWLEHQAQNGNANKNKSWIKSWFSAEKGLPIEKDDTDASKSGQRAPVRQRQWGVSPSQDDRFTVEDKNAATHLVRNALGGKDKDMVCALLTLPSPYSRRYRDDLTVEVIFFGEGDKSGNVVLNEEASASTFDTKSKL